MPGSVTRIELFSDAQLSEADARLAAEEARRVIYRTTMLTTKVGKVSVDVVEPNVIEELAAPKPKRKRSKR